STGTFIGVLWPGDSVIPIVDYPFEGEVAIDCGKRLAEFCNLSCASAQSLSFASHSLGARLVLQAVTRLNRKVQSICLAAAAINRDCLVTEYAAAAQNCAHISLLASRTLCPPAEPDGSRCARHRVSLGAVHQGQSLCPACTLHESG